VGLAGWLQRLQVVAAARVPLAKVVAARQVDKWSLREVGTSRALAARSHLLCVGNVHATLAWYPLAPEAVAPAGSGGMQQRCNAAAMYCSS
jgi:hypothetical protein